MCEWALTINLFSGIIVKMFVVQHREKFFPLNSKKHSHNKFTKISIRKIFLNFFSPPNPLFYSFSNALPRVRCLDRDIAGKVFWRLCRYVFKRSQFGEEFRKKSSRKANFQTLDFTCIFVYMVMSNSVI